MHCPVCGNKGYMIHKGTRDNPSVNVYQCDACGSKYLDRIIANDYENGFMNEEYFNPHLRWGNRRSRGVS